MLHTLPVGHELLEWGVERETAAMGYVIRFDLEGEDPTFYCPNDPAWSFGPLDRAERFATWDAAQDIVNNAFTDALGARTTIIEG